MSKNFLAKDDPILLALEEHAPRGFVLGLKMGYGLPAVLHSTFDTRWREEYESRAYFVSDPIFYWTIISSGRKRWSEVSLPDVRGMLKKAREYDMNYGVIFSVKSKDKKHRSFLSVCRDDREYTDEEMDEIGELFDQAVERITESR